ncbi:spermidine synthase-like [Corticium candelabrum]|uniref:spermidine synthase-like n=1 Tax=Corticium candelabrum TaxID=121492 RepID=UPI002E26A2A0|nr:spermidine synthase-like [Corticium candelabrum]
MSTGKTGKVVDGWFTENDDLWPGQAMSYKIDEVLYEGKSKFQDILVLKTKRFGNLLVLDGIVQCSEKDECVYQEMMTHLPLFCHPNPKARSHQLVFHCIGLTR